MSKPKTYAIDYRKDGKTYTVYVEAHSWNDANQHLHSLLRTGIVVGEVVGSIPVPGWIGKMMSFRRPA